MEYDKIGWGNVKKCSPGLAVEQKLTISISKIVGVGGSVIRGNRDKPEFVKQSEYAVQIENARKIYVVLMTLPLEERGWLMERVPCYISSGRRLLRDRMVDSVLFLTTQNSIDRTLRIQVQMAVQT